MSCGFRTIFLFYSRIANCECAYALGFRDEPQEGTRRLPRRYEQHTFRVGLSLYGGNRSSKNELLSGRLLHKTTVSVLLPGRETAEQYARLFVQLKRAGTPMPIAICGSLQEVLAGLWAATEKRGESVQQQLLTSLSKRFALTTSLPDRLPGHKLISFRIRGSAESSPYNRYRTVCQFFQAGGPGNLNTESS
jgi:hypothetical protein